MKIITFKDYLFHAHVIFDAKVYDLQDHYKKLLWDKHKLYYKVYLLGNNYKGEYDEMEKRLKEIKGW